MSSSGSGMLMEILSWLTFAGWMILELAAAAVSLWRFRLTASGALLGGAFLLMALKGIVAKAAFIMMRSAGVAYETRNMVTLASMFLSFCLLLVVGAGIALIPRSLGKLSK